MKDIELTDLNSAITGGILCLVYFACWLAFFLRLRKYIKTKFGWCVLSVITAMTFVFYWGLTIRLAHLFEGNIADLIFAASYAMGMTALFTLFYPALIFGIVLLVLYFKKKRKAQ